MAHRTISGVVTLKKYVDSVIETPTLVTDLQSNLYGFYAENDDDNSVYLQFYDADDAEDVVPGETPAIATYRIAGPKGVFGKDPTEIPLEHFNKGIVIAVTGTRNGEGGPQNPIYLHLWYWDVV